MEKKPEDRYVCPKCGGNRIEIKFKSIHYGLYCLDCGAWVTWTDDKKVKKDYEYSLQFEENKNTVLKIIKTRMGRKKIRCPCGCLLYSSGYMPPEGQFDLLYAKYCPECGKKLI